MIKMIAKKTLITIGIILSTNAFACDCLWGGSFLQSIEESDVVFIGKVIGYDGYSLIERDDTSFYFPSIMIINVEEILRLREGAFTILDHMKSDRSVRVLGNVKSNCRPNVNEFELGSKWIFKVNKARESNYFRIDLVIHNCSTNYLKIENGKVVGNIEGENQKMMKDGVNIEMGIADLKRKILTNE